MPLIGDFEKIKNISNEIMGKWVEMFNHGKSIRYKEFFAIPKFPLFYSLAKSIGSNIHKKA